MEWLEELADRLIARHINVSIPDGDHEMRRSLLVRDPAIWRLTERKFRCIAVVGAGASAPFLKRGNALAESLVQRCHVDQAAVDVESERIQRITAVDPSEFEAKLAAIAQTLGGDHRRLRAAISDLYRVRHPTIQSYELLAHLLKHRFLDAIISMNFDELLDQSLDDELGVGEYRRIVSERDCVNIQSDVSAPDYIPLYIKLHGTASEPESLRFTRESYFDTPMRIGTEAANLFQVPECVVMNVGFGMGSFDLHRLLAIPDKLWLFNLSKKRLPPKVTTAITQECAAHGKGEPGFRQRKKGARQASSDELVSKLVEKVDRRARRLVRKAPSAIALRSVKRHDAVVRLLGPESRAGRRLRNLPRDDDDAAMSLDPQMRAANANATYAGYLRRRTILELALALARGRGLVSMASLAIDRGGLYYDAYRLFAGPDPSTWRELYTLVGFQQNRGVPDVFQAVEPILKEGRPSKGERADEWSELPVLDLEALADRVLPHISDGMRSANRPILLEALEDLYTGTEYELHSRDDRVCAKTFSRPVTLKTISALDAYTFRLLGEASQLLGEEKSGGEKPARIDIISETGGWLLDREELAEHINAASRVRLVVAFPTNVPKLFRRYPNLKVKQLQPWHHNRHMAIVSRKGDARGAVYFARHRRTPYVTPVLVRSLRDVRVLKTTFKDRWRSGTKLKRSEW